MSNIEALKEQARRHEQKEEWQKACDLYMKAIDHLDEEEQPDIGLYNRVGDILIRLGTYEQAVEHFEKATDLYLEAELPNNAIAVCKKVIRHLPNRNETYLRMGKIRAAQGFLVDARDNFLTYAERMQALGEMEEALRALVEFAELAPDDTGVRMAVATQLLQHEREREALEQLGAAYGQLVRKGEEAEAEAFREKILEIDPEADLDALGGAASGAPGAFAFESTALGGGDEDGIEAAFGEIALQEPGGQEAAGDREPGPEAEPEDEGIGEFADISVGTDDGEDDEGLSIGEDLPLMSFDDDEDGEVPHVADVVDRSLEEDDAETAADDGMALELDDIGFDDLEVDGSGGDDEDLGEPLPFLSLEDEPGAESGAVPDPEFDLSGLSGVLEEAQEEEAGGSRGEPESEWRALMDRCRAAPEDVDSAQRLVELAFKLGKQDRLIRSYLTLADALRTSGNDDKARAVFQQVLALDPDNATARSALGGAQSPPDEETHQGAAEEDYVDLGSLIFGDDEKDKTTRFRVAYQEPTGDEEADFAKMLDQFKAKVAENFDFSDVKAHHDLGTAYREMGLLDEAVEKFQEALRAAPGHLPTYELLGQTFMERGEHQAAVRVLERALKASSQIDDEFIGIYYYLARAYEALGNADRAVEYYDQVFALDINFMDVTDRLRNLR